MDLNFEEYRAKNILNVHQHVDGPWFWGKYTAHPYIGCSSGCEYCYCRGRYSGRRDPSLFDQLIKVKINAIELLRGELFGRKIDIITVGDWQQPAEERYGLSRGMLEVILDLGFPLFIVERSPLLSRDLDLLAEINKKSWVGVVISISNLDLDLKRAFEPRSPGVKQRLETMEKIADLGITIGTGLMPVLPFVGDAPTQIEDVIRATKDHGGSFVLGGGLSMDGVQAERTLTAYKGIDPALVPRIRKLYNWSENGQPAYSPPQSSTAELGLLIRALCEKHKILDRMPRYIVPGPMMVNKMIAEKLFLRTYDLELDEANNYAIWAYRKAAWTIDELHQDVSEIYLRDGERGLRELPNIGKRIAGEIGSWLVDKRKKDNNTL